jgi:hypothetical protein
MKKNIRIKKKSYKEIEMIYALKIHCLAASTVLFYCPLLCHHAITLLFHIHFILQLTSRRVRMTYCIIAKNIWILLKDHPCWSSYECELNKPFSTFLYCSLSGYGSLPFSNFISPIYISLPFSTFLRISVPSSAPLYVLLCISIYLYLSVPLLYIFLLSYTLLYHS